MLYFFKLVNLIVVASYLPLPYRPLHFLCGAPLIAWYLRVLPPGQFLRFIPKYLPRARLGDQQATCSKLAQTLHCCHDEGIS